jgi:hypothetical protein
MMEDQSGDDHYDMVMKEDDDVVVVDDEEMIQEVDEEEEEEDVAVGEGQQGQHPTKNTTSIIENAEEDFFDHEPTKQEIWEVRDSCSTRFRLTEEPPKK